MSSPTPTIGQPYGPGILPQWQSNIDARLESIKAAIRSLARDWESIDDLERNERLTDIKAMEEQLLEDVRSIAVPLRGWPAFRATLANRLRTTKDALARFRIVLGESQRWLIENHIILTTEGVQHDYGQILLDQIDDGVKEDWSAQKERDEDEEERAAAPPAARVRDTDALDAELEALDEDEDEESDEEDDDDGDAEST